MDPKSTRFFAILFLGAVKEQLAKNGGSQKWDPPFWCAVFYSPLLCYPYVLMTFRAISLRLVQLSMARFSM